MHELNFTLPLRLERIIDKALAKDRALRYQTAAEMRADLASVSADSSDQGNSTKLGLLPRGKLLATAAVVVIALVTGGIYWKRSHKTTAKLTDKDTIVLADFDNKTGDAVFDDTLKQGLSVQLEQSPFLDLVSERKVNETLKLMGRPAGDRLTPEVTREVCQRTGSKAMLTGSIAGLGSQYVIGLKAVNCDTGDVLAEAQEQAAGKEAVLKALDAAAVSLRSKLGESLSSVQKYATPLEEATTPSLEALKAYSLGRKTTLRKGYTASLPFYKRAVELDPNFAMAYAAMSGVYSNLNEAGTGGRECAQGLRAAGKGERAGAVVHRGKLLSLRDRRAGEGGAGVRTVAADLPERLPALHGTWDSFPAASETMRRHCRRTREALRLEPNNEINYVNLGTDYANLNRLDEAEAVFKQAEERKLEGEHLLDAPLRVGFSEGRHGADGAIGFGRHGQAGHGRRAAGHASGHGSLVREVEECTRTDAAGNGFSPAQRRQRDCCDVSGRGGAARGGIGQPEAGARRCRCSSEAGSEPRRAGDGSAGSGSGRRYGRGREAGCRTRQGIPAGHAGPEVLAAHNPRGCRLAAQRPEPGSRTIEGGERDGARRAGNRVLCPVYLRGEAYLMLHDGKAAAAEFQKFIDHYGLVGNFPWGALARLGLARAYALEATTDPAARDKARTAYQDFLTLWKDADPDIPIYQQAKAEYAKLR